MQPIQSDSYTVTFKLLCQFSSTFYGANRMSLHFVGWHPLQIAAMAITNKECQAGTIHTTCIRLTGWTVHNWCRDNFTILQFILLFLFLFHFQLFSLYVCVCVRARALSYAIEQFDLVCL